MKSQHQVCFAILISIALFCFVVVVVLSRLASLNFSFALNIIVGKRFHIENKSYYCVLSTKGSVTRFIQVEKNNSLNSHEINVRLGELSVPIHINLQIHTVQMVECENNVRSTELLCFV